MGKRLVPMLYRFAVQETERDGTACSLADCVEKMRR